MNKLNLIIVLIFLIGFGTSCLSEHEHSYECIDFNQEELAISFCRKNLGNGEVRDAYYRYVILENQSNQIKNKSQLHTNYGGMTFINFYIDNQYELKGEMFDVLVIEDSIKKIAFNRSTLENITLEYIPKESKNLRYVGSIRDHSFYLPEEKAEVKAANIPYRNKEISFKRRLKNLLD